MQKGTLPDGQFFSKQYKVDFQDFRYMIKNSQEEEEMEDSYQGALFF